MWIALGAAAQILLSGLYHAALANTQHYTRHLVAYAITVLMGSLSVYSFHRLYSLGKLPVPPRGRWLQVQRYTSLLRLVFCLGITATAISVWWVPLAWTLLAALPAVLSLLYVVPALWGSRARDFGSVKLVWLTLGWVWLCSLVPALASGAPDWWYVLERLFYIGGFALVFDWRDRGLDAQQGVHTWAAQLGERGVALATGAALGTALLMSLVVFRQSGLPGGGVPYAQAATTLLTAPLLGWAILREPGHLYYGLVLDGLLLLPLVLVPITTEFI